MIKNSHEVVFGDIKARILQELSLARHTILFAASWLQEPDILDALAAAAFRGCSVRLILSAHPLNEAWKYKSLLQAGGEVYRHGSKEADSRHFMRREFCMIDYEKVINGPFEFPPNAVSDAENIVLLHSPDAAYRYNLIGIDLIRGGRQIHLNQKEEILMSFVASEILVEKGAQITVAWKVEQAEKVYSPTLGYNLPFSGAHTLPVHADKVIELHGANGAQTKTATLLLRIIRHPEIEWFDVLEPVIIKSQQTIIRWKTRNAVQVQISNGADTWDLDEQGELPVTPEKDTVYTLSAAGDRRTIQRQVRVTVYPLPTFKAIPIPVPTEIKLEVDVQQFQVDVIQPWNFRANEGPLIHRMPKIDRLKVRHLAQTPPVREIAEAFGKDMHEMALPPLDKPVRFRGIKSALLRRMESLFQDNPRALSVISQIKSNYEL